MNDKIMICQDCLRVMSYTEERQAGLESCVCGGDLCGCGSCTDTIDKLDEGFFPEGVEKWDRDTGTGDV